MDAIVPHAAGSAFTATPVKSPLPASSNGGGATLSPPGSTKPRIVLRSPNKTGQVGSNSGGPTSPAAPAYATNVLPMTPLAVPQQQPQHDISSGPNFMSPEDASSASQSHQHQQQQQQQLRPMPARPTDGITPVYRPSPSSFMMLDGTQKQQQVVSTMPASQTSTTTTTTTLSPPVASSLGQQHLQHLQQHMTVSMSVSSSPLQQSAPPLNPSPVSGVSKRGSSRRASPGHRLSSRAANLLTVHSSDQVPSLDEAQQVDDDAQARLAADPASMALSAAFGLPVANHGMPTHGMPASTADVQSYQQPYPAMDSHQVQLNQFNAAHSAQQPMQQLRTSQVSSQQPSSQQTRTRFQQPVPQQYQQQQAGPPAGGAFSAYPNFHISLNVAPSMMSPRDYSRMPNSSGSGGGGGRESTLMRNGGAEALQHHQHVAEEEPPLDGFFYNDELNPLSNFLSSNHQHAGYGQDGYGGVEISVLQPEARMPTPTEEIAVVLANGNGTTAAYPPSALQANAGQQRHHQPQQLPHPAAFSASSSALHSQYASPALGSVAPRKRSNADLTKLREQQAIIARAFEQVGAPAAGWAPAAATASHRGRTARRLTAEDFVPSSELLMPRSGVELAQRHPQHPGVAVGAAGGMPGQLPYELESSSADDIQTPTPTHQAMLLQQQNIAAAATTGRRTRLSPGQAAGGGRGAVDDRSDFQLGDVRPQGVHAPPRALHTNGGAGADHRMDIRPTHGRANGAHHAASHHLPAPVRTIPGDLDSSDDPSDLDDSPDHSPFVPHADQDVGADGITGKLRNNAGRRGRTVDERDAQQQVDGGGIHHRGGLGATNGGPGNSDAHGAAVGTTAGPSSSGIGHNGAGTRAPLAGDANNSTPTNPTAAAADASKGSLQNFSSNLRFFKYLLLLGGLRQQTSSFYRNYIRVTVWGCTLLCLMNIFFRTKSYRNPFFDVTLVIMHIWVSWSFEKWHVFTKSHHWRLLVSIVSQSKTGNFFVHINQVGIFGLIATLGAFTLVCLGWIGPILYDTCTAFQSDGHYVFLAIHGVFMTAIIVPWAAACVCSSVLFHMVVLAHQSDVEHYFQTVKSLLLQYSSDNSSEALEETYGWLVRLHQPVRMRLRMTCHYFNSLYAFAIITSLMLIASGIVDFNDLIVHRNPVWHNVVQDAFFVGLGLVAMYGSLWVTSSLTNYWLRFIQRINELPGFLLTHPAAHSGLVQYFTTADVAYTVYGVPVTTSLMVTLISRSLQVLFVALIIYNWSYFPAARELHLAPVAPTTVA